MKKLLFLVYCLFFVYCSPCSIEAGESYYPGWRPGDGWEMGVVYFNHPGTADKVFQESFFRFEIFPGAVDGNEVYLIRAFPAGSAHSHLFSASYRKNGLILESVSSKKRRAGAETWTTIDFKTPRPFANRIFSVGVDLPVFPLEPGTIKEYSYLKPLSDMVVKKRFVQKVDLALKLPWQDSKDVPKDASMDFIKVEVFDGKDELIFVQYWRRGAPFPVYGKNRNMEYFLKMRE